MRTIASAVAHRLAFLLMLATLAFGGVTQAATVTLTGATAFLADAGGQFTPNTDRWNTPHIFGEHFWSALFVLRLPCRSL